MAVAYRSSTTNAGVASVAVSKPTGAAQGDCLLVSVSAATGGTITQPGGFTQLGTQQDNGTVKVSYYAKILGASEPSTYTFTSTGAAGMVSIASDYSGTKLFLSGSAVSRTSGSATFTTSALTTQFANAGIVTFFTGQLAVVTWTPPSGMTERQDANASCVDDVIQSAAGSTGTKTGTASASTDAAYCIVAIEESPTVAVTAGSYAVTGATATLTAHRQLTATAGSYSVTGSAATLHFTRTVTAQSGSYAVTGSPVTLLAHRVLSASAGGYSVTGASATLLVAHHLAATPGTYTVTGDPVALAVQRVLAAQTGSYAVTGSDATLLLGFTMALAPGAYTLTGNDATLLAERVLALAAGSYAVTGNAVTFVVTPAAAPQLTIFATYEVVQPGVPLADLTDLVPVEDLTPWLTAQLLTPDVPLVLNT